MRPDIATYVVDFDGTVLLRDGDLTQAGFAALESPTHISGINRFTAQALQTAQRKGVYLCICSGNILENIQPKVVAQGFFPDAISCKIGTELWHRQADNRYALDADHTAVMGKDFNHRTIQAIIEAFFAASDILTTPHDRAMNGPGKQSCHVALRDGQSFPELQELQNRLEAAGFRVRIGTSLITEQHEKTLFASQGFSPENVWNFDVVHPDAGKDKIAGTLFSACATPVNVVAGDGGNDADLMRTPGVSTALVVGNAADDLRRAVAGMPQVRFSRLPAGLALVENLLADGHLDCRELPIESLPEPFQQPLLRGESNRIASLLHSLDCENSALCVPCIAESSAGSGGVLPQSGRGRYRPRISRLPA